MSARDDLSLWYAHFGQILLRHIKLGPNITLLDIGPGTGFPLLELAQRLGNPSVIYGIDSWKEAIKRVKLKIFNIKNVKLIEGDASSFTMRFVNGTAFLNLFFIKYAFLDGWKSILPTKELNNAYTKLEDNLNLITKKENELQMSVPIAYIEGKKSE